MTKLITIFDKDLNQRVFRLFYENEIIHKIDTSITISSSKSSIDVGENVILSGVLSDAGGNVLSGKNVRILKNNVLVDTVTTDSNGAYSKTISGLSAGTYHFHASFAGDDTYDNALSSTIDVNVLSHVYVVTLLSDKQSILSSESVTLSGTVTRDGEGYAGQSVRLFDGVTLVDTLTTDSSGNFSKTLSNLSVGTHSLFAQFDAYESSIVVVEVQDHDYAINISADNPIIQTGDTAIITATLTDGSNPVVGETLSYSLTNKGTVVGSGSTTTNNNGEISITYVGAGLGDIDVEVSYSTLLQETYELEDCHIYDSGLTDKSSNYIKSTGMSMTHSTDHYILSNTTENSFVNFIDGLDNVLFECDWSAQSDTYMNGICCSDRQTELYNFGGLMRGDNWSISVKFDNGSYHNMNEESSTTDKNKYEKLQMKIEGNNIIHTVFNENGTVIYTYSYSKAISNKYLSAFFSNANSSAYVKNIKVKAL